MALSPLFIVLAIIALGTKLSGIVNSLREKNTGKAKAETVFLGLMILTVLLVYVAVKQLEPTS